MTEATFRNWRLETDADGIAWVWLDKAESSTNTISADVLEEFSAVLTALAAQSPRGAVILSAKQNGFVAGADIKMIEQLAGAEDPERLLRESQALFDRLAALPFPTCAAIHGFCLGGGLELALACRYRVADDGDSTRLGLPEVMLGLHPGWGGTVRLPKLIGALEALPLILQGRSLRARAAQKLGLVDYAVPGRHLRTAARSLILETPPRRRPDLKGRLSNQPWARKALAWKLRQEVAKKAREEHYPAPYAIIDLWERAPSDEAAALACEARSFVRLARTDTARNLIRVFFLQDRLKQLAHGDAPKPRRVHVVGAGTMGGDIAAWCAAQGLAVTLQDREPKFIAPAIQRAAKLFHKRFKLDWQRTAAMDRLVPDLDGRGLAQADVIVEAVPERLELKQQVLQDLQTRSKAGAVLATNTSSLPLAEIATSLARPNALVGIHFFNPVAKMQLVEVVAGENTDPAECDKAIAFVGAIGRLPLPVKSSPGFLVNRVLMPYLMEAMILIDEGVPPARIDEAAEAFGMPMGPVELADTVGLDICLHVGEILAAHFGSGDKPAALKKQVDAGHLGRKSGKGFYEYKAGKPVKARLEPDGESLHEIADRMLLRLLNEAVACLREGVVADADLLDAGMIFGTGFAPFRGGPLHYVRSRGAEVLLGRLRELEARYGARFKPDEGWATLS